MTEAKRFVSRSDRIRAVVPSWGATTGHLAGRGHGYC